MRYPLHNVSPNSSSPVFVLHAWCKGPAKLCRCRFCTEVHKQLLKWISSVFNVIEGKLALMGVQQLLWGQASWVCAQVPLAQMGQGWVSQKLLKACRLVALVGTNIHRLSKYREEGAEEGFRGLKVMGMEQVGEAVLTLDTPVFVCTALGCLAVRCSAEHQALSGEKCQIRFHGF